MYFFLYFHFRHQIQHYTGQLAKDTSTDLHSLSNGISTLSQSEQVCRELFRQDIVTGLVEHTFEGWDLSQLLIFQKHSC